MITVKLIFILSISLLAACNGHYNHGPLTGSGNNGEFISNGERIYFTGRSLSGLEINASGGNSQMGMHQQMRGASCAGCHGADRAGQILWPRFWVKAPALTKKALFGDADHKAKSDTHGNHASYDADSLRIAITNGLDPAGEKLNSSMPRWSMSHADMNDLIAFLQQAHTHE